MSTRSMIGMEQSDGTVRAIYCHSDGHPQGVGRTLARHYNTPAKLAALIDLGALSVLGRAIGKAHDFYDKSSAECTAYHRDRGDALRVETYASADEFLVDDHHGAEWVYVARLNGRWEVACHSLEAIAHDPECIRVTDLAHLLAEAGRRHVATI